MRNEDTTKKTTLTREEEEDLRNFMDLDGKNKHRNLDKNFITKENFKDKYEELFGLADIITKQKNNLAALLKDKHKQSTICFLDIQGVLIKNNHFHEALAFKKYEEMLKSLCDKHQEHYLKITRFGRFYESQLTEDSLPSILNDLRNDNVELCLLTFARYSKDRENALKDHGILDHFQKQIWTGGISKGLVMMEYLKSKKELGDIDIIFVDDKLTHLRSVYDAVSREKERNNRNVHIKDLKLFLYNRDPVLAVEEEDFKRFWEKVIKSYKKVQFGLKRYY